MRVWRVCLLFNWLFFAFCLLGCFLSFVYLAVFCLLFTWLFFAFCLLGCFLSFVYLAVFCLLFNWLFFAFCLKGKLYGFLLWGHLNHFYMAVLAPLSSILLSIIRIFLPLCCCVGQLDTCGSCSILCIFNIQFSGLPLLLNGYTLNMA